MRISVPSLQLLANTWWQTFQRFPLQILSAIIGTAALWIALEQTHDSGWEKIIARTVMMSALAVPSLVAAQVFGESRGWAKSKIWVLLVAVVALLGIYWFLIDPKSRVFDNLQIPRFAALLAVAHLAVTFAPFLHRREPTEDFWEYNKQLFANWLTGAALGGVIYVGLTAALAAVDNLFEIHLDGKNYGRLFFFIAGVFHPAYFLSRFPKDFEFDSSEVRFFEVFRNLCKFILIPIVALYFLILYAFTAKILVAWTLPNGWVSSLVLGFAGAGILAWLLNFMLPKIDSGSIVGNFKKYFWWVLLPMIGLLFVAIGRRIMEYGITEERFMVAHLGAWLLICAVFFTLIKSSDIKFIPLSLAAFLLVAVFGPFSAFESAKRSQKKELSKLLTANGLLENGKAKPAERGQLSAEISTRLHSTIQFFEQREALDLVKTFFPDTISTSSSYSFTNFLNLSSEGFDEDKFTFNWAKFPAGEGVAGYEKFYQVNADPFNRSDGVNVFSVGQDGASLKLGFSEDSSTTFSLQPLLSKCRLLADSSDTNYIDLRDSRYELENENFRLLLFVQHLNVENSSTGFAAKDLTGFAFLKMKK